MTRKKKRRMIPKPVAAHPDSRRAGRVLLIGLMPVMAILALAAVNARSRDPEPRSRVDDRRDGIRESPPPDPRADERRRVEALIEANEAMNRDFEQWFDIAEEVAGDDAQARILIEFARSSAVPTMLLPGGITQFIVTGDVDRALGNQARLSAEPSEATPRAFEITVADMARRRAYGMRALSDWQYDQGRNQLFVPPRARYSRLYGSILLLHELQHAYDLCTGREPGRPSDREWAEGEARAYELELRLVNRLTNGAASRFARTLADRYRPPGDTRWIWPHQTPDIGPSLREWSRILGEPPATEEETGPRGGTLLVLMNRELAEREGLSSDAFLEFILATRSMPPT